MIDIIEKNKYYFRLYLAFFIVLFCYQLTCYQADALLYFSERRTVFFDNFFKIMTRFGEEYVFIALFVFYLIKKERKHALTIMVTGLVVLMLSPLLKMLFEHPRPYTVFENAGILTRVNLVNGYEILRGMTSFPSGHSMGAFALWSVMAFRYHYNSFFVTIFFTFAVLVGISRVYLVAHFPEDVLLGSALGVLIAVVVFTINKLKI